MIGASAVVAGLIGGVNGTAGELSWADTVAALASVGSLVVVVVAAIFARRQLDEIRRARHAEAMFVLSGRWDGLVDSRQALTEFHERGVDLAAAFAHAMAANTDEYFTLVRVPNFFEDLAIQVEARSIPLDMVVASFGDAIVRYWMIWEYAVPVLRADARLAHKEFERLAREVEEFNRQKAAHGGGSKRARYIT